MFILARLIELILRMFYFSTSSRPEVFFKIAVYWKSAVAEPYYTGPFVPSAPFIYPFGSEWVKVICLSNWTPPQALILWIYTRTSVDSCFCTFCSKITIFYKILRFLQFSPRHFYRIFLLEAYHSFTKRTENPCTFYASIVTSCKHNGAIFYQHINHFNFVSNIFFITLHWGRIAKKSFFHKC